MLSENQYYLIVLAEECGEVQRAIGKALRFGMDDVNPHTGESAREHLLNEAQDVLASLRALGIEADESKIDKKLAKMRKYLQYARDRGTVSEESHATE